jgi:DNA-binding LacI/PurR family transcriptional regulator/DNA-binding transcriptional regulator YhcF (GntR family)
MNHPSTERSLAYIRARLESGEFREGERLPATREMALGAGVRARYMSEAVARLQREGRLAVVHGRGIFAGAAAGREVPSRLLRWQKLRSAIERDILCGNFRMERAAVTLHDFSRRYRASYFICRKAVGSLVADGVLAAEGCGYRVAAPAPHGRYSSVLLIGANDLSGKISVMDERFREFINALELEQRAIGVNLERIAVGADRAADTEAVARIVRDDRHIGYVVWSNGIDYEFVNYLAAALARLKKPCAIADENGDFVPDPSSAQRGPVRVFTIAGRLAGERIGRCLLDLGHRSVAYVSLYHGQKWSQERLRGLSGIYSRAGCPGAVVPMVVEEAERTVRLERSEIERINELYVLEDRPVDKGLTWYDMFGAGTLGRAELQRYEVLNKALRPLCGRIAAARSITACVFCNDIVAIIGLHLLREQGIAAGRDLSLASFDDISFAYQYDLSSYNFAFAGVARIALGFLLNPDHEQFRAKTCYECEGMFMERGSLGRAKN